MNGSTSFKQYAIVLLRLALGAVFIAHGVDKLMGMSGTIGFFGKVGIPAPGFFAWVVAIVETFGGLAVLIGFGTRVASALIACVMVVAILVVKLSQGFLGGWEFDFTLLMVALALVILGSGPWSVSALREGRSSSDGTQI
jgi:uncharacterized membrane protein YphA (DoxX/SURF4 family)